MIAIRFGAAAPAGTVKPIAFVGIWAGLRTLALALTEDFVYQDGRLVNPNLLEYRIPKFRDLPSTFISRIHEDAGGPGPFGAKGVAEGGLSPVPPAVANAVYDAIGVRFYQVPLKSEMIWRKGKVTS